MVFGFGSSDSGKTPHPTDDSLFIPKGRARTPPETPVKQVSSRLGKATIESPSSTPPVPETPTPKRKTGAETIDRPSESQKRRKAEIEGTDRSKVEKRLSTQVRPSWLPDTMFNAILQGNRVDQRQIKVSEYLIAACKLLYIKNN